MSAVTFIMWGIDKAKAKLHHWRVPENTLLALAIAGGCLGAAVGMLIFRHKIRKVKFKLIVLFALLGHVIFVLSI